MRILLAPAKKMRVDTDTLAPLGLPDFLDRTERLLAVLRSRTPDELRALWKCNEAIAAQNVERLAHMDLRRGLTRRCCPMRASPIGIWPPACWKTRAGLFAGASADSVGLLRDGPAL